MSDTALDPFQRARLRCVSIVPMMTPFADDGAIDEPSIRRVVEFIVRGGCQAVLVAGTTGEAASMSVSARSRLAEVAVAAVRDYGGLVFGGIGDNSMAHSLALADRYSRAGVHALVAHLPSYYPIGADDMERYLRTLADAVARPLFIYNIPQTTRLSLPLEVIERLSHHPRILGIKDSEPDGDRQEKLARLFVGRRDFAVFCGSVPFTTRAMLAGADGFVPSAGNIAPSVVRAFMDAFCSGDMTAAQKWQQRVDAISSIYQKERTVSGSLCALKAAMAELAICERHMLPPLRGCADSDVIEIRAQIRGAGLLPVAPRCSQVSS